MISRNSANGNRVLTRPTHNSSMQKRSDRASLAGWLSIVVNTILFILKYWAGIVTGSVALIADAWHTLSDSISSIVLLLGIRFANKPADKEHPFGHGRYELVSALTIGAILGLIGYNFLLESIERLQDKEVARFGTFAIIVTILSILGKEGLAQYSFYVGRLSNNNAVVADAWHHRSDALSSIIILLGIIFGTQYWWLDGVLGILVSVLIGFAAWKICHEAINKLLGEKPDDRIVKKLNDISYQIAKREIYLHHTHIHTYGDHKEITFHIRLPSNMTLDEAHVIATKIERKVQEELNMQATIHMEPLHDVKR
jgi:cation diffusion facilitator family transporter